MKKVILLVFAVFGIILSSINQTHAIQHTDIDDIVIPTITYIAHGEDGLGSVELFPNIEQVTNELTTSNYEGLTLYIVSPNRLVTFQYNLNNVTYTFNNVSRFEIIFDWYVSAAGRRYHINLYNSLNELIHTYDTSIAVLNINTPSYLINNDYNDGLNQGMQQYGYFDGSNWITSTVYGSNRYNAGLNENRNYYGIYHNGQWLTAEEYGNIRYEEGLEYEIDWWSWSVTFFLMPFRILNIEILPGVRIGYFALFSLLIGVVGWFFFIVGKGGGKRK